MSHPEAPTKTDPYLVPEYPPATREELKVDAARAVAAYITAELEAGTPQHQIIYEFTQVLGASIQ